MGGFTDFIKDFGGVVGAGVSAIGSVVGGVLNKKGSDNANQTNLQIAREQNDFNLAQWNRENEYNTPENQMQRLKDAGVNPNLAYSNGTTMNVSAESPRAVGAQISPYLGHSQDISSAIQNFTHVLLSKDAHDMNKMQQDSERLRQMTESARNLELMAREQGIRLDNETKRRTQEDLVKLQHNQTILAAKQVQLSEAQYNSEIMRQSLMDADGVIKDKQAQVLAEELKKVQKEANLAHWKSESERINYLSKKYEHELNKAGFSTKDPLYANIIRQMVDDPVYARYIILGLEGVQGAAQTIGNVIGGVGKGVGAILKGSQPNNNTFNSYGDTFVNK